MNETRDANGTCFERGVPCPADLLLESQFQALFLLLLVVASIGGCVYLVGECRRRKRVWIQEDEPQPNMSLSMFLDMHDQRSQQLDHLMSPWNREYPPRITLESESMQGY